MRRNVPRTPARAIPTRELAAQFQVCRTRNTLLPVFTGVEGSTREGDQKISLMQLQHTLQSYRRLRLQVLCARIRSRCPRVGLARLIAVESHKAIALSAFIHTAASPHPRGAAQWQSCPPLLLSVPLTAAAPLTLTQP